MIETGFKSLRAEFQALNLGPQFEGKAASMDTGNSSCNEGNGCLQDEIRKSISAHGCVLILPCAQWGWCGLRQRALEYVGCDGVDVAVRSMDAVQVCLYFLLNPFTPLSDVFGRFSFEQPVKFALKLLVSEVAACVSVAEAGKCVC